MNESKTWANLSRYEARYFRELRQGAAELRRVQKGRRDAEADEVAEAANEEINSESEPICKNEGNEPALSLKTLQNTILPNEGNEVARSLFAILQNEGNGTPLIWIHYSYQRAIIVDHAKIPPTSLANFPVLILGHLYLPVPWYSFPDRIGTLHHPSNSNLDRNTLNMWIDACWPEGPPFVFTKPPSRYNLRR